MGVSKLYSGGEVFEQQKVRLSLSKVNGNHGKKCDKAELSNVEGSATPLRLRTIAIGLLAIYGSRGNAPTVKNYAFPSDVEAKSLECDDYN